MLKTFGQFKGLLLELRTKKGKYNEVVKRYGKITGESCIGNNGFFIRKNSGWENAYETKVYFDASEQTIKNLRKLGINVYANNFSIQKYEGDLEQYPYCFANTYWFWKFVEYGYRLDGNENIPFEQYKMREHLKDLRQDNMDLFHITNIESDNVIYEALLLAS